MSAKTYYTTIDSDIGQLELEVSYDFDPGEKGDGYLQPPVLPEVTIRDVKVVEYPKEDEKQFWGWLEEEIYNHETE